jgi:hypothetical protein
LPAEPSSLRPVPKSNKPKRARSAHTRHRTSGGFKKRFRRSSQPDSRASLQPRSAATASASSLTSTGGRPSHSSSTSSTSPFFRPRHSVYVGIAAGAGLPALAAYAAILVLFAHAFVGAARAAGREVRLLLVGVLAATTGHLVTDAFMSPDLTGTWLFWTLLGAGAGLAAAARRPRKNAAGT